MKNKTTQESHIKLQRYENIIDEFRKLLNAHDWTYEFSDDYRVWKRGTESHAQIHRYISNTPEDLRPILIEMHHKETSKHNYLLGWDDQSEDE